MGIISHYLSAGNLYQNVIFYTLLGALVCANIILIKKKASKKAASGTSSRDVYRDA